MRTLRITPATVAPLSPAASVLHPKALPVQEQICKLEHRFGCWYPKVHTAADYALRSVDDYYIQEIHLPQVRVFKE